MRFSYMYITYFDHNHPPFPSPTDPLFPNSPPSTSRRICLFLVNQRV